MDLKSCSEPIVDAATGKVTDYVPTIKCIFPLVQNIIYWAFIIAGIAAVIFIIWGGIKFITSRGDQKQVQGARQIITYAIIGLILILSSYLILRVFASVIGVECITSFGFDNCATKGLNGGGGGSGKQQTIN